MIESESSTAFANAGGIVKLAGATEKQTISIPMTFTGGKKVKYYKVSVKATK